MDELYQEFIVDHSKNPRNFGRLEHFTHQGVGYNPLCGDKIILYLRKDDDDRLAEVSFQGEGCAICTASTSLMTVAVTGQPESTARHWAAGFLALLTGENATPPPDFPDSLLVLQGVRAFPMRVKCATLAWHTLVNALDGAEMPAKTE